MADPQAFRLNLEQQKKRAKELVRAARAGDERALAHFPAAMPPRLADAQRVIARGLGLANWAALKMHVDAMDRMRAAIDAGAPAPDGDMTTLHIRCGSDIRPGLADAGFTGDFLEHAIPYCQGPVSTGPDRHRLMARFLVDAYPDAHGGLVYERELEALEAGERRLHESAEDYERVVLWMEHDSWDQLVLARLLAHYAGAKRPNVLELVAIDSFPGAARFIGLGQLPDEALRLLWSSRQPVTTRQLALGAEIWAALAADSPERLAAIARTGTPALPVMAPALDRHLRELPSTANGLSLTEQLVLEIVAEGETTLSRLFALLNQEREPLPWLGDLGLLHVVEYMLKAAEAVMTRTAVAPGQNVFGQPLAITGTGLALLNGELDWHRLMPPPRWVGGVHIQPGEIGWRWDVRSQRVAKV